MALSPFCIINFLRVRGKVKTSVFIFQLALCLSFCAKKVPITVKKHPIFLEIEKGEFEIKTFREKFEEGIELYIKGEVEDAKETFKLLAKNAPSERLKTLSLYNLASCYERMGDDKKALEIFERLSEEGYHDATLRIARIRLAEGRKPPSALEELAKGEGETSLIAKALVGLFRVLSKDPSGIEIAEEVLSKSGDSESRAITLITKGIHLMNESSKISPESEEKIERKAELLLSAQKSFFDAIRTGEAWWATVALFKLGETYSNFYRELISYSPPDELTEEEKEVYNEELAILLRPAIEKAIYVHERNISFARMLGIENKWVEMAERELKRLKLLTR